MKILAISNIALGGFLVGAHMMVITDDLLNGEQATFRDIFWTIWGIFSISFGAAMLLLG